MELKPFLTVSEQVASFVRGEVERGRWRGTVPGMNQLAKELGVNSKTVASALRQLEQEGYLQGQGSGRNRRVAQQIGPGPRPMLIGILPYDPTDRHSEDLSKLQHALVEAGHAVAFPKKTLTEIGMQTGRVGHLVNQTAADAWVVSAGSREVLEWFATQPLPVFAMFGRRQGLSIAGTGPDKLVSSIAATRQLITLGHRRIVNICRRERRLPTPGDEESAFLAELANHGIAVGDYNIPDWKETKEGLQTLLESLFQITRPTALLFDEPPIFAAGQQFLARKGIRVPEDVSVFCTDSDPTFAWCVPAIAHIRWDLRPAILRILRWAKNVSRGRKDLKQTLVSTEFVMGGTIGPPAA